MIGPKMAYSPTHTQSSTTGTTDYSYVSSLKRMPLTAGQVFGLQIQTIWDFIPLTTAGTLGPSLKAPHDLAGYAGEPGGSFLVPIQKCPDLMRLDPTTDNKNNFNNPREVYLMPTNKLSRDRQSIRTP